MVKCDVLKQVVTYGEATTVGDKEIRTLASEQFVPCVEDRRTIVSTHLGRVGLCPDHLAKYQEMDLKAQRAYFRLRHGKIVAGPPEEG